MLQDLSLREGSRELPEKGISGRIRVPIRVFEDKWWQKYKDGEDRAMMRREGERGLLGLGLLNNKNGDGRGVGGVVKLLRSSMKNLEGGGTSVRTSSISYS